jgi:hypothetical protein
MSEYILSRTEARAWPFGRDVILGIAATRGCTDIVNPDGRVRARIPAERMEHYRGLHEEWLARRFPPIEVPRPGRGESW